jgi:pimeloyl-ACP methyl ester carboxylesterase
MKVMTFAALLLFSGCATAHVPSGSHTQSGLVNVGDATINYASTGSGKAIVFIHGWSQHLGIWDDQVAAFASRYRVIRFDSRGFGESGGHADPSADPDDLRILLDSLGVRTAHVVGLSRGAGVALRFAVLYPERVDGLVLYGIGPPPGFQPAPTGPRMVAVMGELARKHGLDTVGKLVFASPLMYNPPGRPDIAARFWKDWAKYRGRDLLDPRPESGRTPVVGIDRVNEIRAPTLIVHGDHERPLAKLVADTLVRRMPNARKVVITDGGHGAHFAQPGQFNKALNDFFDYVAMRR